MSARHPVFPAHPPRGRRPPRAVAGVLALGFALVLLRDDSWAQRADTGAARPAVDGPDEAASGAAAKSDDDAAATITIETLKGTASAPLASLAASLRDGDPPVLVVAGSEAPLDEVLFLRTSHDARPAPPVRVLLHGGDAVGGRPTGGDPDSLELTIAGEKVSVSLDHVRAVVATDGFDDASSYESFVERRLAEPPSVDRLFLRTGVPLEGVLESLGAGGVRFSTDSLPDLLYPWDRIRAVALAQFGDADAPAADGLAAVVESRDGSRWTGALRDVGARGLTLEHALLGPVTLAFDDVLQVSVRGGRCRFLSDGAPDAVEENLGPLLLTSLPYRRDRSVVGTPLRMGGETWAKGLGVHAFSKLSWSLDGEYVRFQTSIGLDETARPEPGATASAGAAVTFRVWVDDKKVVEETLRATDTPRRLDVDIAGARTLALEADYDDARLVPVLARANWGRARIIRADP